MEDKLSFDLYLNFLNNTEEEPGGSPVSNDENDDDAPNKRKKARGNDGQPVSLPFETVKCNTNEDVLGYGRHRCWKIVQGLP